jgi:hypothetical protein
MINRQSIVDVAVALVMSLGLFAGSVRDSEAQRNPYPSPAATVPQPAKKKCCFCIVADPGMRNADDQKQYCQQCLMSKTANPAVASCEILQTVAASQFRSPDPAMCSPDMLTYNLEHGPILEKSFERIKKCIALMPTCNLEFIDLSCSSFGDADQVQKEVEALQALLGPDQQVTVCGNGSDNYTKGCAEFVSARKQIIITSTKVDDKLQPCARAGTYCAPPRYSHRCIASDGTVQKQICCGKLNVSTGEEGRMKYGVWGTPGNYCAGSPKCPPGCDKRSACLPGNVRSFQECVQLAGGDYTCVNDTDDCGVGGKFCNPASGTCEAVTTPVATGSPASSQNFQPAPRAVRNGAPSSGESRSVFREVDRGAKLFEVSPSVLATASLPRNLLGTSSVSTVTGAPGFQGILLRNVDPASTLGILRFEANDIIHFVNGTPVTSVAQLSRALASERFVVKITFTRGTWRWVITMIVTPAGASRVSGGDAQ